MKKLSELAGDTVIIVGDVECGVMTKDDFLQSADYLDGNEVELWVADIKPELFSWDAIIEWMEEDGQYEGWAGEVLRAIDKSPELQAAEKVMNEIFAKYPTCWEGEEIENDMQESVGSE